MGTEQELEDMTTPEMVDFFAEEDGHLDAGRELMRRVLEHAGLDVSTYFERQLKDKSDQPMTDEQDEPLRVRDYLNISFAKKNFGVVARLIEFVTTDKSSPDYGAQRDAMEAYVMTRTVEEIEEVEE